MNSSSKRVEMGLERPFNVMMDTWLVNVSEEWRLCVSEYLQESLVSRKLWNQAKEILLNQLRTALLCFLVTNQVGRRDTRHHEHRFRE